MRGQGPALPAVVAVLLTLGACGGGGTQSPAAAATPTPAPTPAPNLLAKPETVGGQPMTILVDDKGMTLYRWAKDGGAGAGKINCVAACAAIWPPFVLSGTAAVVPGPGLTGAVTTITNPEGKGLQVVYKGWPLYYYVKDKAAGDTTGQGVGGTWFVVAPDQAPNS